MELKMYLGGIFMGKNMEKQLNSYKEWLFLAEKSPATIEKYVRIVRAFFGFLGEKRLEKEQVLAYKEKLVAEHQPAGVNAKLAALNSYLKFIRKPEYCVKYLKIQKKMYRNEERELSKEEYLRLEAAAGTTQIAYIMKTILATGIRVSELEFITVEAVGKGETIIYCKGKVRYIYIPQKIRRWLKKYCKRNGIQSGVIFCGQNGKPIDRSVVWRNLKRLCVLADVAPEKVFPHNLRHLFARTYYRLEKDIVRLADILGHSSVETTRGYTLESRAEHQRGIELVQRELDAA